MKRILVKLPELLAVGVAINLQLLAAFAQGAAFTTLKIVNPLPAYDDVFGFSVAAMGNDRVLIGAYLDDTGAFDAGAAYLFSGRR